MVKSFKEVKEEYNNHPLAQEVSSDLSKKEVGEIIKIKEKSREILKEMLESNFVSDREDKNFLLENVIKLTMSKTILEKNMNFIIANQERKLVDMIPNGFNLSVLLHPDFPYTLSFIDSDFEGVLVNHENLMKEKQKEIEKLKNVPNFGSIVGELDKLNKLLSINAMDKKNEKNDLDILNSSLSLLNSCPF